MFRIRFHGRGGQGIKTASRVLGTAFFIEGFEVQDAPLYGAERRGAPIYAYVRADRLPINERGVIRNPDVIAVADDTLAAMPAVGVINGATINTVLLIRSEVAPDVWQKRLNFPGTVITIPLSLDPRVAEPKFFGIISASAVASLVGTIKKNSLERAIREELSSLGLKAVEANLDLAFKTFDYISANAGKIKERLATNFVPSKPDWVDFEFEGADVSAPSIRAEATSERVNTGLWRTVKPVIDYNICRKCWWLCSTYCPEGAITVGPDGRPRIDYDHCKGCLICMAQCPTHAISEEPERKADAKGGDHL